MQHKTLLTWELVLETQDSLGVRLRDVAGHTLAQACVQSVIGRAQSTAGAVDGLLAGLELQVCFPQSHALVGVACLPMANVMQLKSAGISIRARFAGTGSLNPLFFLWWTVLVNLWLQTRTPQQLG